MMGVIDVLVSKWIGGMQPCMYRLGYMIELLCTILDFSRKLSIFPFSFVGPLCKCIL